MVIMRQKSNNQFIFLPILLYVLIFCFICLCFSGNIQLILQLFIFCIFCLYCFNIIDKRNELSLILVYPVFLSVFQNIWLGLIINRLTTFNLQIYLSFNILFVALTLLYSLFRFRFDKATAFYMLLLVALIFYSFILLCFYPVNLTSWTASLRNIITPILYLSLGLVLGKRCSKNRLINSYLCIGIVVILFGLFEIFIDGNIWLKLNVAKLWTMKGILPSEYGFPANFYSSESFFGVDFIKRMSSTFADPVNLGTFLLCIVLIAVYKNKKLTVVLSLLCCALTISKGALLGILISVLVWVFFKSKSKALVAGMFVVTAGIGILFLIYSKNNSTGSVFVHLSGFFSSFKSLIMFPFGLGCGNVGVLSTIFATSQNEFIIESGMGAIIGELGIIGLIIYISFFVYLLRQCWMCKNLQSKILSISLVLSIFANIMFNEVALSPNSCGIYFILVGLLISDNKYKKVANNSQQKYLLNAKPI